MKKFQKKQQWNSKLTNRFLPKANPNKDFQDLHDCFIKFNRLYQKPHLLILNLTSLITLVLSIIPLVIKDKYNSSLGWIFWGSGLIIGTGFEQIANFHYYFYGKKANLKNLTQIKKAIFCNCLLRSLAIIGWVLSFFAIALIVIFKSGNFLSIW